MGGSCCPRCSPRCHLRRCSRSPRCCSRSPRCCCRSRCLQLRSRHLHCRCCPRCCLQHCCCSLRLHQRCPRGGQERINRTKFFFCNSRDQDFIQKRNLRQKKKCQQERRNEGFSTFVLILF